MERKPGPMVEGALSAGGGGGGRMKLAETINKGKAAPQFEIWSKRQNKMVTTASNAKSAEKTINRRDADYGGYDHYKKLIGKEYKEHEGTVGPTKPRWVIK